jgi:steroid delta-isomerase-like uncharacterized protein
VSDQNKALVSSFYEAWNSGNLDAFDEILSSEYQDHDAQNPNAGTRGPEGAKATAAGYRAAYPDSHFAIDALLADGDYVIARWTATGTHDGELMGIPPTGKAVSVSGITIDRVENGKVVEGWTNWDTIGMMQQLGVIPA